MWVEKRGKAPAEVIEAHVGRTGIAGRFIASCRNCRERLVRINDTFIGPCYSTNCDVEKVRLHRVPIRSRRDNHASCVSLLDDLANQLEIAALCARSGAPWRRLRDAVAVAVAVAVALERVNVASRG
ncbi:hypothetical protein HZH66_004288 [Vespula vulgaris]|uniref:Uncharacterized protein n=1 Tax=Vespula vulgaris TaxID=7454 RepID=A0A834KEY8_VESVU|nr:hypothetical protein HZH66_004288 [Vespula vulgaris]